jgi:hypothetical protein
VELKEERENAADATTEATAHASDALPHALKALACKAKDIAASDEYLIVTTVEQEDRPAEPDPDDDDHADTALLIGAAL